MIIPAEITAKHSVTQEDVFRHGPHAAGIEDAVFEFATIANDHLLTARDMFRDEAMGGKVPLRAMPVFLAGVCFYFSTSPVMFAKLPIPWVWP